MRLLAVMGMVVLFALLGHGAFASGCFEPCPDGEIYSEAAEMCVAKDAPST